MDRVKRIVCMILILSMLVITGCWDRRELNDRAILLAFGTDIKKNGLYRASAQFAIPSKLSPSEGGGAKENAFITVSGEGRSLFDAADSFQLELSRSWFAGHREFAVFGEEIAKQGLSELMDVFSRSPETRMRTDMFIVKGGTAEELLKLPYPLDRIPAIAMVKIHDTQGVNTQLMLRDFLMAATSEGTSPVLPALEILPGAASQEKQGQSQDNDTGIRVRLSGAAVFNKALKLVGYLNNKEAITRRWIRGELQMTNLTAPVPGEGTVVMQASRLKSKIEPSINGNKVKINITLTGQGILAENDTKIDLSEWKTINKLEEVLQKEIEKQTLKTIQKVQRQFKTDAFGFGENVRRKYPHQWKSLKKNWEQTFSKVEVSVTANLSINRVGLTGAPLMLKENEIKK